jgi:hypothetical protein
VANEDAASSGDVHPARRLLSLLLLGWFWAVETKAEHPRQPIILTLPRACLCFHRRHIYFFFLHRRHINEDAALSVDVDAAQRMLLLLLLLLLLLNVLF